MCCPSTQNCISDTSLTTVWRAQAPNTNEICWKIAYMTEGNDAGTLVARCPVSEPVQCFSEHAEAGSGEENSAGAALPLRVTAVLSSICSSVQCQYDNTADIMAHNYTQHLSAALDRAGSGAGAGRWADNDDTRTLDTETLLWHDCRWHYYVTMVI